MDTTIIVEKFIDGLDVSSVNDYKALLFNRKLLFTMVSKERTSDSHLDKEVEKNGESHKVTRL